MLGVSISLVVGDNGILNRATEASKKANLEKEKEYLELAKVSAYTEESGYRSFTLESLNDALDNQFGKDETTVTENPDGSFTVMVKKSKNEYQLTSTGIIINVNKVNDETPAFLAGEGTKESPYLIESIEDLVFFSYQVREGIENYKGKFVELTTDLNFASSNSYVDPNKSYPEYGYDGKIKEEIDKSGFIPIGSLTKEQETCFSGTFNGKYNKIINLKINGNIENKEDGCSIGFFTVLYGTIENLNVILNSTAKFSVNKFSGAGILVGGVGHLENSGTVKNCQINGNITMDVEGTAFNLGGICGALNGEIINCSNNAIITINANITDALRVGGICGALDVNGIIKNCYNSGNINVTTNAGGYFGGICGILYRAKNLENVYNIGTISEISTNFSKVANLDGVYCTTDGNATIKNIYSLPNLIQTNNKNSIFKNNFSSKTNLELSGQAGVTLLNEGNDDPVWAEDKNNINNGYPILNWQDENN